MGGGQFMKGMGCSNPSSSHLVDRTVRGSSSVGGWGFDKGTAWHPVSLPPSLPVPKGSKPIGNKPSSSDRYGSYGIIRKQFDFGCLIHLLLHWSVHQPRSCINS